MSNPFRWQAPGNGKIFDSPFNNPCKMTQRSLCILRFVLENSNSLSITYFENKIWDYLEQHTNCNIENNSMIEHFYRPLLFYGFLRLYDGILSVSIEGRMFLDSINKGYYEEAMKCFIRQILQTSYPNVATRDVKLDLYPFKIAFTYLLNEKFTFDKKFICYYLPYIKSEHDFSYINNVHGEHYEKLYTWVFNSFVGIGLLKTSNGKYSINDDYKGYVADILHNEPIYSFFMDRANSSIDSIQRKSFTRNKKLVDEILEKSNYQCYFDSNHITFKSKSKNLPYMEAHHIIPLSLQSSFSCDLDCSDNLISVCPNCHKKLHLASDCEREPMVKHMRNRLNGYITLDDLKQAYNFDNGYI